MRTELYWINGPWKGRLAIAARPRGGDWLEDEVRSWRQAGVDIVVSLLTPEEVAELDLGEEGPSCRKHGVEFFSFPVLDRGVPASRQSALMLAHTLTEKLSAGKRVAVHCRQGIGRSSLLAACLLVAAGEDADTAFQHIRAARGCPGPDTPEQREWVRNFASELETHIVKSNS